nr:uncharacterized protein CTRU02_00104 [Colletotrichum truncatum]KAF6801355.1 hypothetical protein CTRU02_00104 [Colletotrichum truncatum]
MDELPTEILRMILVPDRRMRMVLRLSAGRSASTSPRQEPLGPEAGLSPLQRDSLSRRVKEPRVPRHESGHQSSVPPLIYDDYEERHRPGDLMRLIGFIDAVSGF